MMIRVVEFFSGVPLPELRGKNSEWLKLRAARKLEEYLSNNNIERNQIISITSKHGKERNMVDSVMLVYEE